MLECYEIEYNYRQTHRTLDDNCYDVDVYTVGTNGVIRISNVTLEKSISQDVYLIRFNSGNMVYVYNVSKACYKENK